MDKRIHLLIIILLLTLPLFAQVQDLPDVEISGPSLLRSFLEKRGLSGTELIIPDVVDSLNPLFPGFPKEDLPSYRKIMKKNALHLNYSSWDNLHGTFLADSLLGTPLAFKAGVNYNSLDEDWTSRSLCSGILYQNKDIGLSLFIKQIYSKYQSTYYIDNQTVRVLNLNYYFTIKNLLKNPLLMHAKAEIQNRKRKIDYSYDFTDIDKFNFNHNVGFSTTLSEILTLSADGYYVYTTPIVSLNLALREQDRTEKYDFLKSISLYATDQRILPGIHLSKRFSLDSENTFHLYQKSALNMYENYGLMLDQPWQQQLNDPLVAFKPLDAKLIYTNQNISLFSYPVMFTLACGVQYIYDEPVYFMIISDTDLPILTPETVFKNTYGVSAVYNSRLIMVSQSLELNKGWLKEHSDREMPYLPFLTLASALELNLEPLKLKSFLNQYYTTEDEQGNSLEEALDLGAEASYQVSKNFSLYVKGQNLLNKGKIIYRTLPTEPVAVFGGLILTF